MFKLMRKFLSIIYFKIYGLVKEDFNAVGILTVLLSFNILTIVGYYETLIRHHDSIRAGTVTEIIVVLIIFILVYINFSKGENAGIAYEEFKRTALSGKKGSRITAIYITITLLLSISLIWM